MQENTLDWFGKPKYGSFEEWKAAKKSEAEGAARLEKVNALKKAARLGIPE